MSGSKSKSRDNKTKATKKNTDKKKKKEKDSGKEANHQKTVILTVSSSSDSKERNEVEEEAKSSNNSNQHMNDETLDNDREDKNVSTGSGDGDGASGSGSSCRFPTNRIQRIIRSEGTDFRITQEAVFLINKATEHFLELFCEDAYACGRQDRQKAVSYKHLSSVVGKGRRYDFLSDFVPEKVRAEDALSERLAET